MSLSFRLTPTSSPLPPPLLRFNLLCRSNLNRTSIHSPSPSKVIFSLPIRCVKEGSDHVSVTRARPRWENALSAAASLYPLYVSAGGVVACFKPSVFQWFVHGGPTSYGLSLGLIMLAMGLTLELKDLFSLFLQRPLSVISSSSEIFPSSQSLAVIQRDKGHRIRSMLMIYLLDPLYCKSLGIVAFCRS